MHYYYIHILFIRSYSDYRITTNVYYVGYLLGAFCLVSLIGVLKSNDEHNKPSKWDNTIKLHHT